MKRRTVLLRTLTGALSATVFTAAGWLMGTRTLTMPPPQCPGPDMCPGSFCGPLCWTYGFSCHRSDCGGDDCKPLWAYGNGCSGGNCACICEIWNQWGNCGEQNCHTPCLN